jgi:hypothetical protein
VLENRYSRQTAKRSRVHLGRQLWKHKSTIGLVECQLRYRQLLDRSTGWAAVVLWKPSNMLLLYKSNMKETAQIHRFSANIVVSRQGKHDQMACTGKCLAKVHTSAPFLLRHSLQFGTLLKFVTFIIMLNNEFPLYQDYNLIFILPWRNRNSYK